MNYYTSDLHFGHRNIINIESRPFKDLEEMEFKLVQNWNYKVCLTDHVYILGDFSFYRDKERNEYILNSLNGKKHLIVGNHDQFLNRANFDKSLFESIDDIKVIHDFNYGIVLCHYPIQVWYKQHQGYLHFYRSRSFK